MKHYDPWWHVTPDRNLSAEQIKQYTSALLNRELFRDIDDKILEIIQETHININNVLHGKSRITLWDAYVLGSLIYLNATKYKNSSEYAYLETGTAFGGSAIFARKILDWMGANKQSVITIDPFGDPDFMSRETPTEDIFIRNIARCNAHNIHLIVDSSYDSDAVNTVKKYNVHTMFIDGDHTYHGVYSDWKTYNSLITDHIIFHDYKMLPSPDMDYGVGKAVDEIVNPEWAHTGHLAPANVYVLRKQ